MTEKFRWGILSTASISRETIRALKGSRTNEVRAVASRDADRAAAWAEEHGIPTSYGSYDELLTCGEIDAVYNPLPNSLHAEWTIRALQAGLPVLCEKPLAVNAVQARRIAEASARTGLPVVEAFMYRHHPIYAKVFKLLESGAIGEVVSLHSRFNYLLENFSELPGSAELAGGALMDVGCYCVDFSRLIAGCEPLRVSAFERRSAVDELQVGALEFPGGILATFETSIAAAEDHRAEITGTRASLVLRSPWHPGEDRSQIVLRRWDSPDKIIELSGANSYRLQAEEFARVCTGRTQPKRPLAEAVANMAVIDALFESAREGRVVSVRQV